MILAPRGKQYPDDTWPFLQKGGKKKKGPSIDESPSVVLEHTGFFPHDIIRTPFGVAAHARMTRNRGKEPLSQKLTRADFFVFFADVVKLKNCGTDTGVDIEIVGVTVKSKGVTDAGDSHEVSAYKS